MNPSKNRFTFSDTFQDMAVKLCEGNPGALNVLIGLAKEEATIDPDSVIAPYGTIFHLDSLGIYGSHIWILFKYYCDQSLVNFVALFRACQMGFVEANDVIRASQDPTGAIKLDVAALLKRVQEALPEFGQTTASPNQ